MVFKNIKKQRTNSILAATALFLTAAMSLLLCACGTAGTAGSSPTVTDTTAMPTDSAIISAPPSEPAPPAPAEYAVYALHHKNDGNAPGLRVGEQAGLYPWGYTFDISAQASHTTTDAQGTVFYSVEGDRFRLFYQHIEESGKDVISTFMTAADTGETMRGIKRGDTVDKLLEAYDSGLLYQPEPEPVSETLGGDFCVYDTLFIYTRPEDDNCRLVFYVCDGVKGKTITGIEISLGQDDTPRYVADNIHTFPVDYSSPEQYTKTDTSAEEKVYALLHDQSSSPQPSGEAQTMHAVLDAMADFNWRIYSQLYPTASIDLIDWLYNQKITEENDILSVLKATDGLDGAFSEGYASVIGNIYLDDHEKFIRLSSQLNSGDIDHIARMLHYGLLDEKDQITLELTALRNRAGTTTQEQRVIDAILHYFKIWSF